MTQVLQREAFDNTATVQRPFTIQRRGGGEPTYRLDGTSATPDTHGLVIEDGRIRMNK
jgi:hypothetical protein